VQTAGSTLTAQQPENNIVRTTMQALAAVLGGAQSLHTNAYDEALSLPTASSARLALRTQQLIAAETGITETTDPLAGSYYVENLSRELEDRARAYLDQINKLGGMLTAIETGWVWESKVAREGRQDVNARHEAVVGLAGPDRAGQSDHAHGPDLRLVHGPSMVESPEGQVRQVLPVVTGNDQDRVVEDAPLSQVVQQSPDGGVHI